VDGSSRMGSRSPSSAHFMNEFRRFSLTGRGAGFFIAL
jgi:hypothetical protein